MARIKSLGFFQKVVLAVVLAMAVVFTVVYAVTTARVGYSYQDAILVPAQEDGTTVYSGKVKGKNARITVDPDGLVTFQYDDKTFGPYTVREDPSAIPEELTEDYDMTGVEIRCGEDVFFRGCMNTFGGHRFLYNEDGSSASIRITYTTGSGEIRGEDGNVIDPPGAQGRNHFGSAGFPGAYPQRELARLVPGDRALRYHSCLYPVCRRTVPVPSLLPNPKRGSCRAVRMGDGHAVSLLDGGARVHFCALPCRAAVSAVSSSRISGQSRQHRPN